jgi:hypothetical protein
MNDESILNILEETAEMLTIKLDYEDLRRGVVNTDGGIFTLKGDKRILIHKGLGVKDKVKMLASILSTLDTDGIHIPPAVRKRLEEQKKGDRPDDIKPMPDALLAALKDG